MQVEYLGPVATHMGGGTVSRIKIHGLAWQPEGLAEKYFFQKVDAISNTGQIYLALWPNLHMVTNFVIYKLDTQTQTIWHSDLISDCPEKLEIIEPHKVRVHLFRNVLDPKAVEVDIMYRAKDLNFKPN